MRQIAIETLALYFPKDFTYEYGILKIFLYLRKKYFIFILRIFFYFAN
jgi:hypothetical protein